MFSSIAEESRSSSISFQFLVFNDPLPIEKIKKGKDVRANSRPYECIWHLLEADDRGIHWHFLFTSVGFSSGFSYTYLTIKLCFGLSSFEVLVMMRKIFDTLRFAKSMDCESSRSNRQKLLFLYRPNFYSMVKSERT